MTACGCPVNAPEANPEQWDCPCGDHCPHCNKGNTVDQPTDLEYAATRYGLNRPDGPRILNAPKWACDYLYTLEGVIDRICVAVRLDAGNDTNGNPRRLYLVIHPTIGVVASIAEEYHGPRCLDVDPDAGALRSLLPAPGPLANAITMSTTASEYRSTVKEYGPGSIARLGAFKALGVRQ